MTKNTQCCKSIWYSFLWYKESTNVFLFSTLVLTSKVDKIWKVVELPDAQPYVHISYHIWNN